MAELKPKSTPKWLDFLDMTPGGRKTKVYHVRNKEKGGFLGEIRWYGAWRKYAFFTKPTAFPNTELVFESTCLQDITDFLNYLMQEWKIAKQSEKHNKE